MDDRSELQHSFDPRTWKQESPDEEGAARPPGRSRAARGGAAAPPFFLAAATAMGILSVGAATAFLTRAEAPATEVAAALEPAAGEIEQGDAGASVAGEQP